jgi:uncharacterized protein (DUF2236 family)
MSETLGSLGPDDERRIKEYSEAACKQLQEMEDIRESLKDLTKKIAEELDVKPAKLMKAVKIKFKNNRDEERATADLIDAIVEIMD